jgi:methyl-accepting chemotaxis protein
LLGLAVLATTLLALYHYTLATYADRQAEQRVAASIRVAWDVLKRQGDDFRVADGKLLVGDASLNGRSDLMDHMHDMVGGVATIFMGDVRIATNVKKAGGSRAVGTALAPGPVHDALFQHGQPYRGKAEILGQPYFVAYDPIRDNSVATIGALFVGQLEAETHAEIASIQAWALSAAAVISLCVCAAAIGFFRRLFKPLARLRDAMTRISDGDLAMKIDGTGRGDDIGRMAAAVEVFRVNALERIRAEAEAEAERKAASVERDKASAEREVVAQQQEIAIRAIDEALRRLASKDLSHRIETRLADAYEPLRTSFNASVEQLSEAFSLVAVSAVAVKNGTDEIAAAGSDLSKRTEHQASSLEESVAALKEVAATVKETAAKAKGVTEEMALAREEALDSEQVVHQTADAMSRIEQSSRKIGEIIGVIDEIAFQTNLLALNAGVEAARAGEAGRGFAVVASEVRALAQRSAESAKDIKALIAGANAEVNEGVALVSKTGDALTSIEGRVLKIDKIINVITEGAQSEATALAQVSVAINEMGTMTQQNASMAEEATAASQSLARESQELSKLISQFTTAHSNRTDTAGPEGAQSFRSDRNRVAA